MPAIMLISFSMLSHENISNGIFIAHNTQLFADCMPRVLNEVKLMPLRDFPQFCRSEKGIYPHLRD